MIAHARNSPDHSQAWEPLNPKKSFLKLRIWTLIYNNPYYRDPKSFPGNLYASLLTQCHLQEACMLRKMQFCNSHCEHMLTPGVCFSGKVARPRKSRGPNISASKPVPQHQMSWSTTLCRLQNCRGEHWELSLAYLISHEYQDLIRYNHCIHCSAVLGCASPLPHGGICAVLCAPGWKAWTPGPG